MEFKFWYAVFIQLSMFSSWLTSLICRFFLNLKVEQHQLALCSKQGQKR